MNTYRQALLATLRLNVNSITPVRGFVTALPVALVFVLGLLWTTPMNAVGMAMGANLIAIVSLVGAPQLSLRLALTDVVGIAGSVFVASASGSLPWLHDLLLVPLCFVAGLAVIFGLTQGIIGSQLIVAYVVLGRTPHTPLQALLLAVLVGIGSLSEVLALVLLRLPASLRSQRSTVAAALEALADYAMARPEQSAMAALAAIDEAQRVLSPTSLFGRTDTRDLQAVVDQLRRSRIELTTIAGLRQRLEADNVPLISVAIDDTLHTYAAALLSIAREIRHPATEPASPPQNMRVRLDLLAHLLDTGDDHAVARQCAYHLSSLRTQLQSCRQLARVTRLSDEVRGLRRTPRADRRTTWHDRWATVRSHLTPEDTAFRHAIRLTVAVVVATSFVELTQLPRGYWVVYSVAVILKPDYATLLRRGLSRVLGTALGASVAALYAAQFSPSHLTLAIVVLVIATLSYAAWAASFAVAIGLVSSLVLLMLSTTTTNTVANAGERFLDVAIGAAIAAAAYLLWPSSPRVNVDDTLRTLREDLGDYLTSVMLFITGAGESDKVASASRRAHFAFSRAESSVAQALDEPASMRPEAAPLQGTIATSLRLLRALHALRLHPEAVPVAAHAPIAHFATMCEQALTTDGDAEGALMAALDTVSSGDTSLSASQLLTLEEVANAVVTLNGLADQTLRSS